ncbi:hypothetical protein JCM5350_002587 [Sporobolomyces pararoseus]
MSARSAFSVQDIRQNVLQHLYTIGLDEPSSTSLLSACLVNRSWSPLAQTLLQRHLRFIGIDNFHRIREWLQFARRGGRRLPIETVSVEVECKTTIKEDAVELCWIGELMKEVKGVRILVMNLMGQQMIPVKWIADKNISSDIHKLLLGSPLSSGEPLRLKHLRVIGIFDSYPTLLRDWGNTLKAIALGKVNCEVPVGEIEICNLSDYYRYLVPDLPLRKNHSLVEGSILPFAAQLRYLSLPNLLPVSNSFNLAIIGVACHSLQVLEFFEISARSTSSIPVLRFVPSVQRLQIRRLVGLPSAPWLRPEQLGRLAASGRGDVVFALASLLESNSLSQLSTLSISKAKFFYHGQHEALLRGAARKGRQGGAGLALEFPVNEELTENEAAEVTELENEAREILDEEAKSSERRRGTI